MLPPKLAALLLLLTASAGAPAVASSAAPAVAPGVAAAVPMAEEQYHHLLFENARAAVYDVVLPPGALMRFHRHPTNHLAVVIAGGTLRNEVAGAPPRESFTGPGGTVVYIPAGPPHRQSNVGSAAVHFVAAEVLAAAPANAVVDAAAPRPGCEIALDNAVIVAWRCRVAPGGVLPGLPAGVPFLRVALGEGTIAVRSAAGVETSTTLRPGSVTWQEGAAREDVRNSGGAVVDLVEIAWRPPGKPVRRTADVPEVPGASGR